MIDISAVQQELKQQVLGLTIVLDPTLENPPISAEQLAAFVTLKSEMTAAITALPVATKDDFAVAGQMLDSLDVIVGVIDERLKPEIAKANAIHKSLTGTRGAMAADLEDLVKSLKSKRSVWKTTDDARKAREAAEARAKAEAEAKRIRDEQARLAKEAADRIAEEARIERERVAEAARVEAARVAEEARVAAEAAAELEDPMEALAAAQEIEDKRLEAERKAAEEATKASEDQADRAAEAALALQLAEQAAAAPVVAARVEVAQAVKEDGVSWVDKWEAEWPLLPNGEPDEHTVLLAVLASLKDHPDLIMYVSLNAKMVNKQASAQKSLFNIPGVKAVNNKTERRSSK